MVAMRGALRRSGRVLGVVFVCVLTPRVAPAATVGTASVALSAPSGATSVSASGCFSFADAPSNVFGTIVNLASVGPVTLTADGEAFSGGAPSTAPFEAELDSCTFGGLSIDASGSLICPIDDPLCTGRSISMVATSTSLANGGSLGLPSGLVYRLDGAVSHTEGDTFTGELALNAFKPVSTPCAAPPCAGVTVQAPTSFYCPDIGADVTAVVEVTYGAVTSPGTTTVTASCNAAGTLPAGFAVALGDYRAGFLDISTTASITPPVRVCLGYAEPPVGECLLRILHKEGTDFVPRTLGLSDPACPLAPATTCLAFEGEADTPCMDPDSNVICAEAESLSLFAIGANADQPDQPISGRKVVLRTNAADPSKNKLQFVSKDSEFAPPSAVNSPLVAGATLRLADGGGQEQRIDLPPATCAGRPCWRALGSPPGSLGYRYKDQNLEHGPCRYVLIQGTRVIKAICQGAGVSLAPPLLPPVDIALEVGAVAVSYCAEFDDTTVVKNDLVGQIGTLKAKRATAPAVCGGEAAAQSVRRDRRAGSEIARSAAQVAGCPDTCLCGEVSGQCHGACPAGERCEIFNDSGGGDFCACVPAGPLPCGKVGAPTCDGICPDDRVCSVVSSECRCLASTAPCGGLLGPLSCSGVCPPEAPICATLNNATGGDYCGCVPGELNPCGSAGRPACDAACDDGLVCHVNAAGFECLCVLPSAPCGALAGAPSCSGACPEETPLCTNVGGTCTCTAPTCGDGVVNQPTEDCDGTDDALCPGECFSDCTCQRCNCYFTSDCPIGTFCDLTAGCLFRLPKPLGVIGAGCNVPWNPSGGGPCDGYCTGTVLGSSLATEDPSALTASALFWGEALIQAGERGGGVIDQELSELAMTAVSEPAHGGEMLRHVASVLFGLAGPHFLAHAAPDFDFGELAVDFSDNPCERLVSDLSQDPCLVDALRYALYALMAEIGRPGSAAAILDDIPNLCPHALANALTCAEEPDELELLKRRVSEIGVVLRTRRAAE
jgi:hypothetical protein